MKGHVKLELRDSSGVTKVVEQDNLITNAVPTMLANIITSNKTITNYLTLANQLGGILLFGDTLIESKDNIVFPNDIELKAYGAKKNDTSNKMLGTYVASESGSDDNGLKLTWDFSSSQANGIIKSIALSNADINSYFEVETSSAMPFGQMVTSILSFPTSLTSSNSKFVYADEDGNFYVVMKISSDVAGIYKVAFNLNGTIKDKIRSKYTKIKSFGSDYSKILAVSDEINGYVYIMFGTSSSATIKKYIASDGTFDEDSEFACTLKNVPYIDSNLYSTQFVVLGNYVYMLASSGSTVLKKYSIETGEVVEEIDLGIRTSTIVYSSSSKIKLYETGSSPNSYVYLYDIENRTMTMQYKRYSTSGQASVSPTNKYGIVPYNDRNVGGSFYLCQEQNYLGTICNLETPIEKTSDQTLRVTYTLTDIY